MIMGFGDKKLHQDWLTFSSHAFYTHGNFGMIKGTEKLVYLLYEYFKSASRQK